MGPGRCGWPSGGRVAGRAGAVRYASRASARDIRHVPFPVSDARRVLKSNRRKWSSCSSCRKYVAQTSCNSLGENMHAYGGIVIILVLAIMYFIDYIGSLGYI